MNSERGLSGVEAARRLAEYGPNEPAPVHRLSALRQLLQLFANPLVIILLVAGGLSGALGQRADASIIVTIVVLGVTINFWQAYRSTQAAERLRSSVVPNATVLRDGTWIETPLRDIVPGDLFRLSAGDMVPADARLLESRDLSVQQSMLTGESLPADKHAAATVADATGPDAPNLVFLGTSVVSGTATALATATGAQTMFGDIAVRLRHRAPDTEFELGLHRFSLLILRTTVTLVLFIVLMGIVFGHNAFDTLLFAVALGVGLTPEFLPMISSVTLTRGALRLAREQVIVKRLPAIQNFGSIDILCSDKTGTLTSGVMHFDRAVDATGASSPRPLTLAFVNSSCETGIRSPLDVAILQQAASDTERLPEGGRDPVRFPAASSLGRRRSPRHRRTPAADHQGRSRVGHCRVHGDRSGRTAHAARPPKPRRRSTAVHERMSEDGMRVLAVAYRWLDRRASYSRDDEKALVLAGFVSFLDPVLPDAADVLAELKRDGVTVKILTGDNERVARHVCQAMSLDEQQIVTGEVIAHTDDAALGHLAEQATVFARVSPAQKDRIILALKRRGHVVGYIGDGINDAPSLHTADVGISVMTAADVARDAADVILRQPDLRVLHRGILEGRRASGNMMKYLLMGTSSNFGNMFSMAAASVFLPFLPMLPTQILLNNFLYDIAQLTIPADNVDRGVPAATSAAGTCGVIRDFMLFIGPISSLFDFLTFYVLLRYFRAGPSSSFTRAGSSNRWRRRRWCSSSFARWAIPCAAGQVAALTITTLAVVAVGVVLPMTPLAQWLGFTRLPGSYFVFLISVTLAYLVAVEIAKRRLVRRLGLGQVAAAIG